MLKYLSSVLFDIQIKFRTWIVGAGAVVIKDVPAYSVVAGVPVRVIKMRK